ncbi:MAG: filamentous hemagglutinin N-terminal domain-containing protein, partial [Paucibacter sp.]|nr:filamentous hemagglutinin N-terminal domain-containing protein [Roseateles sp.]
MNNIYCIVWSEAHQGYVVTHEKVARRGKPSSTRRAVAAAVSALLMTLRAGTSLAGSLPPAPPQANALPSNGVLSAGAASIGVSGNVMTVNQSSQNAIINWTSFDIGGSATVNFLQPNASAAALNRVLSANPTQIYGELNANGRVFIVNPQGVVVGQGAQVNVGSLLSSSLDITDSDFLAGNYKFQGGASLGPVGNAGSIKAADGGFVAMIGGQVSNTGLISAKLGSVALASGQQVTLSLDGAGLLSVAVPQATLNALVQNAGAVYADGGRIILTGKSANQVLDTVVNNQGILQAQALGERDGQIWMLAADAPANTGATGAAANLGAVKNAAGSVVSGGSVDANGGQVTMAGSTVEVDGTIKAGSSTGAAGQVLINSSQASTLSKGSVIDVASAGAAGSAVVWSAGNTTFHGSIQGQGSGPSGHGATVEISAGQNDSVNGSIQVGAAAAARAGTLLLDPATLEIGGSGISQSTLQAASGAIVLSADGQITVDALSNNVLNLANATSVSITSNSTGGIQFLNGVSGPSGIMTNNAPVTLTASGNGSLLNVGQITTHGANIALSGVTVQLGAGLDASTAGNGAANGGTVSVSIFGGGVTQTGAASIAGSAVTLDATYGYIGSPTGVVQTHASTLNLMSGGVAYVNDASALSSFAISSNHLTGTPVAIQVTAPNLSLTGQDTSGNGSLYNAGVSWVQYSATANGQGSGPATVSITQDTNLLPASVLLPGSNLNISSSNGMILGGNSTPISSAALVLRSPYAIGGINAAGGVDDFSTGGTQDGLALATQVSGHIDAQVLNSAGAVANNSIVSLNQTGNLSGNASASYINLQASGNIGSSGTPFALVFDGQPYNTFLSNLSAGQSAWATAGYDGNLASMHFETVQATQGSLSLAVTQAAGSNGAVQIDTADANEALTLSGVLTNGFRVSNATSNTSINVATQGNHGNLEVDSAVLNGADNVNRSITISSDSYTVNVGDLSTDGAVNAAAGVPMGTLNVSS